MIEALPAARLLRPGQAARRDGLADQRPALECGTNFQVRDSPALNSIWPAEIGAEMRALRDKALAGLAGNQRGRQRFLYWTWTFDVFLTESVAIQDTRATPAGKTR